MKRRSSHPGHPALRGRKNKRRAWLLGANRHCRTGGHHAPGALLRINPPDTHIPRDFGRRTLGPSNPRKADSKPAPEVVVVKPRPTTYTVSYVGPAGRGFGLITVAGFVASRDLPPTTQVFRFLKSHDARLFATGIEKGGTPASWERALERREWLYYSDLVVALT